MTLDPHPIRLEAEARPIEGYQLVKYIARGGFGPVWQAQGPGGIPCALKFVPLDLEDPKQVKMTQMEVRSLDVMKEIGHPHLVRLFGAWQKDGIYRKSREKQEWDSLFSPFPPVPLREASRGEKEAPRPRFPSQADARGALRPPFLTGGNRENRERSVLTTPFGLLYESAGKMNVGVARQRPPLDCLLTAAFPQRISCYFRPLIAVEPFKCLRLGRLRRVAAVVLFLSGQIGDLKVDMWMPGEELGLVGGMKAALTASSLEAFQLAIAEPSLLPRNGQSTRG